MDGKEDNYLWNKCEEGVGEEEDVDIYIPPSWDTDKDVPQEQCLVIVKMRKKLILKFFRCYLVVENKTKKNLYCFLSQN